MSCKACHLAVSATSTYSLVAARVKNARVRISIETRYFNFFHQIFFWRLYFPISTGIIYLEIVREAYGGTAMRFYLCMARRDII